MSPLLHSLSWHRLSVTLKNIRFLHALVKEHPLSIINGIIENINSAYGLSKNSNKKVFFHLTNKNTGFIIQEGAPVPLEIFFCGFSAQEAALWQNLFIQYFSQIPNLTNYEITGEPTLTERNLQCLTQKPDDFLSTREICLEFLSPVPFNPDNRKDQTALSKTEFFNLFSRRISKLFGIYIPPFNDTTSLNLVSNVWHYKEIKHYSKSNAGEVQHIKGCIGKLYVNGNFSEWLPLFIICSELHAGEKIENAQGYFILHKQSVPFFNQCFSDKNLIQSAIKKVSEKYDSINEEIAPLMTEKQNGKNSLAEEIYTLLNSDTYQPSPTTVFPISKKDGSERMIEKLSFIDLIIQYFLLEISSESFEKMMEKESLGYRKGKSREQAAQMISEAVKNGYVYVLESDIEDFFPSVDLQKLVEILNRYIPLADEKYRQLLFKCLRTPFYLNGEIQERKKGLAQGSPLSPLLSNVYLDDFDEKIKSWDARLIRYADDFVILTKTEPDAEKILSDAGGFLNDFSLKLKKEKTAIRNISNGFNFLGMCFVNGEIKIQSEEEIKLLRKPLYVMTPYTFLSLSGDNVELKKNKSVIDSIPLRRISGIIVMESCATSSMLLKKCMDFGIPVTLTLNTGYFITTIRPDSKKYYDILLRHGKKFDTLSESEKIAIAKSIAATKFLNFIPLFKNRYEKGTNEIIAKLNEGVAQFNRMGTLEQVRGMEGALSKNLFKRLNLLFLEPGFSLIARERKKPDRINSMLNFGFYLLFTEINSTLRALGLNPYLGFLHSEEDNYESLACDLMEPFRAEVVRIIIKLINLKQIQPDDFNVTPKGHFLTPTAKKKFIYVFQESLNAGSANSLLTLRESIFSQCILIKNWIDGNTSLTFYPWHV